MKKWIAVKHEVLDSFETTQTNLGVPFLANNRKEALELAYKEHGVSMPPGSAIQVDDLGKATDEEARQRVLKQPTASPAKLDYQTWQKVTEVAPPECQPVWLRSPSPDESWDYGSFVFYNLDDCKGCPNSEWMPIVGHDYGGTRISMKDLGGVTAFNQKVLIEQVPADPIDECSLPSPTKIVDISHLFEFTDEEEDELRYGGDEPINVQITSTIAIEDAPTFQNKLNRDWPLELNQWVTFSVNGRTRKGQIVAAVLAEPDMATVIYNADGKGDYQHLNLSVSRLTALDDASLPPPEPPPAFELHEPVSFSKDCQTYDGIISKVPEMGGMYEVRYFPRDDGPAENIDVSGYSLERVLVDDE